MKSFCCLLIFLMAFSSNGCVAASGKNLVLVSPVFGNLEPLPARFTCDGEGLSPALSWHNLPDHTQSLALLVDDPDAPDPAAPKMTWVHWVLYDIPPSTNKLEQGISANRLPAGTLGGQNSWKQPGYGAPCPPIGRHRYFFKLYALDVVLPNLHDPTERALMGTMTGHILGKVELIGTYQRRQTGSSAKASLNRSP
jgi:Raf kinase inhibitor-like YbhB/YbcL family protein